MFTGRSEFRLSLRSDNADVRLTERGYKFGCVGEERYKKYAEFKQSYDEIIEHFKSTSNSVANWKSKLSNLPIQAQNPNHKTMFELLKLDNTNLKTFEQFMLPKHKFALDDEYLMERIKIQSVYDNAESQQNYEINDIKKHESFALPDDFDYNKINISKEAREKLFNYKPTSLGKHALLAANFPNFANRTKLTK
jgi:tRNA uridine 5-carboxymethylaminomethyl modification enzyme